jgi:hypothetical protein
MNNPQLSTQELTPQEVLGTEGETPIESAPEAPAADERVSSKLGTLVRREKLAIDRERAAKERESQLEQRLRDFEAREAKLKEFDDLWDRNPLEAIKSRGKSYQDMVQVALNDGNVPPELQIKRLEEKFDNQVRNQQQALMREKEEAESLQARKEQETIDNFKGEINSYLKENAERYEFIHFENNEDLVYGVIDEHYERTKNSETGVGEVLTIVQAADKVEQHLEQKYDKVRTLKKMQTLLAPKQVNQLEKQPLPTSQKPKTLSNTLSASPSKPRNTVMSDDERIAKAIAYARGLRA